MKVVDLVHQLVPPLRRRLVVGPARRLLVPELEHEPVGMDRQTDRQTESKLLIARKKLAKEDLSRPGEANDQTDHEAPESPRLVAPGPEHGEEVHGTDGGCKVAKGVEHLSFLVRVSMLWLLFIANENELHR